MLSWRCAASLTGCRKTFLTSETFCCKMITTSESQGNTCKGRGKPKSRQLKPPSGCACRHTLSARNSHRRGHNRKVVCYQAELVS